MTTVEVSVHLFGKPPIIEERDIIETYGDIRRRTGLAYLRYLSLIKETSLTKRDIAKELSVCEHTVYDWSNRGVTPYPWKAIKWLKNRWLVPLRWSDHRLPVIARLCGFLMGDGHIELSWSSRIGFTSKLEELLATFKNDVVATFGKQGFAEYDDDNYTDIHLYNAFIARFFSALGVPSGAKVLKDFEVPSWIKSASIEIKKHFLSGLLSSELSKIQRQGDYKCFKGIEFGMSKRLDLLDKHIKFLRSIMGMLEEVGIQSRNLKVQWKDIYIRRDGFETVPVKFWVSSAKANVARLVNEIPLIEVYKQ